MTGMEGMSANPLDLLPEILLLLGAVGGLLLGLWTPQHKQSRVRILIVVAALASAVAATVDLTEPDKGVFDDSWMIDTTTGIVRITVALATAAAVLLSSTSLAGHPRETEAYVLMVLAALGAIALAASNDLLMLAAAYLLASVPLYALAGFAKDARGVEAALKYYLMGALVGVLMLVGIAGLILATGSGNYVELSGSLPQASMPLVALGVIGVLAGMAFKAGAVPVHFWVPDVTAGTTPAMAAFITTIPKLGAVAAAFRLVAEPFAAIPLDVPLLVAVIAAASMTLGNLAAFQQTEVLRLLAYSTVSQVGYMFMVVAVAGQSDFAVPALAIYLAGYAVTNLGAFAAAAALPKAASIGEWADAVRGRPRLVLSLAVLLLGLVGTPPTAVFIGKLTIFTATADGNLVWLLVLGAVNTIASLFYYLRWIAPAARTVFADSKQPDHMLAGTQARAVMVSTKVQVLRGPAMMVHAAAVLSVLLGIGAGVWLTFIA
ncbi:proton-conducting transporter membrane subunit [Arthrobacter sp. H5]|uniref:NADH-quinone oxidoreductase subunit N n=1 Tax=Arthrobacter sp. H5 TaxID=1267973 RepID=UPI0004804CE8|nr:proton-conducting transporter membrane subunit [Arthrobacter sp. H5]